MAQIPRQPDQPLERNASRAPPLGPQPAPPRTSRAPWSVPPAAGPATAVVPLMESSMAAAACISSLTPTIDHRNAKRREGLAMQQGGPVEE